MTTSRCKLFAAAMAAVIAGGCSNSPPGAGFTSGDKPTFTADEKPGIRDDLQAQTPDSGDAKLAGSAANIPDPGSSSPSEAGKAKAAAAESQPK
jgi:hypothetical protein